MPAGSSGIFVCLEMQRKQFLATALAAIAAGKALGAGSSATGPYASGPAAIGQAPPGGGPAPDRAAPLTIRQLIDLIQKDIPGAPFLQTVDTIKSGDADQPVKGVVTTMFATDAVIEKAIRAGANFIIAHEPTFYNHLDETDWLDGDPVYAYKKALLEKNGIVVWRFHDGWHTYRPDGILMGVLTAMGWDKYYNAGAPEMITIPSVSLGDIVEKARRQLSIGKMQLIGDLTQSCQRILLSPGAAGGRSQIAGLRKYTPDLFICGELNEWETAEYIRDARYQGKNMSLLVLGHSVSEEPGMAALVPWLQERAPGLRIEHIPSGSPFTTI
jgi:putative NIF3 family GTP cyclohydrolase 1 type 2